MPKKTFLKFALLLRGNKVITSLFSITDVFCPQKRVDKLEPSQKKWIYGTAICISATACEFPKGSITLNRRHYNMAANNRTRGGILLSCDRWMVQPGPLKGLTLVIKSYFRIFYSRLRDVCQKYIDKVSVGRGFIKFCVWILADTETFAIGFFNQFTGFCKLCRSFVHF